MYIHILHAHLAVMLCIYFLYLYLSHPTLDYALLFFRNALLFFTLIRNWTFRVTYVNFFINGQRFVFSSMLSLVFFILAFISSIISRASYVDPTSAPAVIKHLHFEGFFSRSFLILSSPFSSYHSSIFQISAYFPFSCSKAAQAPIQSLAIIDNISIFALSHGPFWITRALSSLSSGVWSCACGSFNVKVPL